MAEFSTTYLQKKSQPRSILKTGLKKMYIERLH